MFESGDKIAKEKLLIHEKTMSEVNDTVLY